MEGIMVSTIPMQEFQPMSEQLYIIQPGPGEFFAGFESAGNAPLILTPYPSAAMHVNYEEADRLCWFFRLRGYQNCVACDIRGNPVTPEMLTGQCRTRSNRNSKGVTAARS
jgi:hypothetical protein